MADSSLLDTAGSPLPVSRGQAPHTVAGSSAASFRQRRLALPAALAGVLLLSACVSVPQGPTVAVMPGSGKSLEQFQNDNVACQQFAQASISGATQTAQNASAANAVGGAALGAAVGALIGSATGQAGAGAAWGAGTGLMVGGAAAGNSGAVSSYSLQRQFDVAYTQCMYTHGNQVPTRVARRRAPAYAAPAYAPPPPASYSVPSDAAIPPPGTPAPEGLGSAIRPPPN